jgi:hypothetical protein
MKNLQKHDFVTCVAKHGNSTAKLKIGTSYRVVHIKKYTLGENPKTREFTILDDRGMKRVYLTSTKMFERTDGTDLFNDSHFNIMRLFANEIENLTMCSLQADISEDDIEKDKSAKIKEYLIKLMKVKK